MTLFKAQTIPQFMIHQFLVKEGLQPAAVAAVSFPDRDSVSISDGEGSAMTVQLVGAGVYDFTYSIHGEKSTERRLNPDELNVTSPEAAP